MDDIVKLICASSLFILFYSMVAKYVRHRFHIPDPLVTLCFGILIGHHCLNILNTHYVYSKVIVLNFSRIVLCLQTMAISLKIEQKYLRSCMGSLLNLIVVGGVAKCLCSFVVIYFCTYFTGGTSWALAAALTPTDPILCSSIVSGRFARKNVNERLRNLLVTESGINDSIGIILLSLTTPVSYKSSAAYELIINTIGIKIILSAVIGAALGKLVKFTSRKCYNHQLLTSDILMVHSFALTFLILSIMSIVDGSELICIFTAGIFLNEDSWYTNEQSNSKISDVIENSFFMALFVFLGSRIDFSRFNVRMVVVIVAIITIRILVVLLLYKQMIPEIKNVEEACFIGFFGPIGVAAIYYSLLYDIKVDALTVDYAMCSVLISVLLHGLSVPGYCMVKKLLRHIKKDCNTELEEVAIEEWGL